MPRPTPLLARWPARKAYADAKEAERLAAVEFTPDDKLAEWLAERLRK